MKQINILNDYKQIEKEARRWMNYVSDGTSFDKREFYTMAKEYYESVFNREYFQDL